MKRLLLSALLLLFSASVALGQSCLPGPSGSSAITQVQASTTGTTATISATLPGAANQTTYTCGFFITSAGATTATARTATLTGTGTTLSFAYSDPVAAQGDLHVVFGRCLAASAPNTSMTLSLPGTGTGTVVAAVTLWGCQQ